MKNQSVQDITLAKLQVSWIKKKRKRGWGGYNMSQRRCTNWLSSLLDYVEESESPRKFWLWAGISTIASALQRKVWVPFGLDTLYPNMYILLVAPPGRCRKGAPLGFSKKILTHIKIPVFVDSPTKRALTKELAQIGQTTQFMHDGKPKVQSSMAIVSKELSSFLAVDPKSMIEALTDLYDAHEVWEYKTSEKGTDKLFGVCVNCLMATTPSWMSMNLPKEAIGGGFTSRFILVAGEEKYKFVPMPPLPDEKLYKMLVLDLLEISKLVGEFSFDPVALRMYEEWYGTIDGLVKKIRDDRLHGYLERIHIMAIKTAMALSVSETNELIIRPQDMDQAITLLHEVLQTASKALGAHGRSEIALDTDRVITQIRQLKEVSFQELHQMNWMHASNEELMKIVQNAQSLGRIECVYLPNGELIIRHKKEKI